MDAKLNGFIDTGSYRETLEAILESNGLGPESLELTEEFPNEPLRVSKCMKVARKIMLKKRITPEEKAAAIAEISRFEFPQKDIEALSDDAMFLKHTVLRYVCSIQQRWQPDYECAKWAFYQMRRV